MTFTCQKLRDPSEGQACVRCGNTEGVVGCHYTGVRRLSYGGGYGIKVHDFLIADLCQDCHRYMDSLSRNKDDTWLHSEEFQHCILLTLERRFLQGVLIVRGTRRSDHVESVPKLVARRTDRGTSAPSLPGGAEDHLEAGT